jgi:hypothetical protein
MSDRPGIYSRIQRRETHASRATPAIIVAVILILALAYLVTEIVLATFGQKPLLASPATMVQDVAKLSTVASVWLAVSGAVLAILGIVLLTAALSSGRRSRHVLQDDRAVVVVENEVIASALVRTTANTGSIDPDRAVGSVSHRTAVVTVTPTSGVQLDKDQLTSAMREQLQDWKLKPALRPRVRIKKTGKVGA